MQLFEFADKYRGSYQASCPFYCSYSGYQVIKLKQTGAHRYFVIISHIESEIIYKEGILTNLFIINWF